MPEIGMYTCQELEREFRQAELVSGVWQYYYNVLEERVDRTVKPYAIILTQDCDLLQDYNRRQEGKPGGLNGILFFEVKTVAEARNGGMDRKTFEKVSQNTNERYHFLQSVNLDCDLLGQGLPDLIIDFKKYFTISTTDFQWQILLDDGPKRRSRLLSPYLEHLQCRAAYYMSRVGLPVPHRPAEGAFQAALPAEVAAHMPAQLPKPALG